MEEYPMQHPSRDNKNDSLCNEFDMRIDRHGVWFHQGGPIKRIALVKLFSTILNRHSDGTYWLTTPAEHGRIEVEDAPFIAVELFHKGKGNRQEIDFRTNIDDVIELGPTHSLRIAHDPKTGEPAPYISLNRGLEAKLNRAVFYHLVELTEALENHDGLVSYGVWSREIWFPLGEF
jgi:hypothetical protein